MYNIFIKSVLPQYAPVTLKHSDYDVPLAI